jgi:hypothetical protein
MYRLYTYIIMEAEGTTNKREYLKKYYEENKERIKSQIKALTPDLMRRKIVSKLNNNEYTRTPYTKIKKHNIIFDSLTGIYN